MKIPTEMPRLKGFRFPRAIIAYAVWAYYRFALSTADVEDLLAERGVIVSRETVRKWVNRFGSHFANCVKRDRPAANDKWHLDEALPGSRCLQRWEGGNPNQWPKILVVASNRRQRGRSGYPWSAAEKRKGRSAVLSAFV